MNIGLHHMVKKRMAKKGIRLDSPWKKLLNGIIYFAAGFGFLGAIPQLIQIYTSKNASGVSLLSWIGYFLGSIIWLAYGMVHKEKPIILSNATYLVVAFFIVVGIVLYS